MTASFVPASRRTIELEVASRAAIGLAVPLLVLWSQGRLDLAAYATFGAFTGLYGRSEPYRSRIVSVTLAAVGLLVCMALGVTVSMTHAPLVVEALLLIVVLGGGSLFHSALQAIPGQPIFYCFAFVVTAIVPVAPGSLGLIAVVAVGSAAFAWLVCHSGWILRRILGPTHPRLFRPLPRSPQRKLATITRPVALEFATLNVVGAWIAGAIALGIGLGHTYWAVVSLVACLPASSQKHTPARALHRVVGTAIGAGVAAVLLFADLPPLAIIVIAVVCQFGAEMFVARNYSVTLIFLTPLALLVSNFSVRSEVEPLVRDRLVDTAIGAAVSLALLVVLLPMRRRRARALPA